MSEPKNVLILCTGNSARSIMAEAIFNREGGGRWRAFSAGSQPTGEPNPFALRQLRAEGYDTGFARSKSWDEFAGEDAPAMDLVVTVCDSTAEEICPVWPGAPLRAHWGVPDPTAVDGSEEQRRAAFEETYGALHGRIAAFLSLPEEEGDAMLRERGTGIGPMEPNTQPSEDER
jgi:protein-tyrosine-phosphatase